MLACGALLAALLGTITYARWRDAARAPVVVPFAPDARTRIGLNLFGLANFNRQPVFANLIAQSEWFVSKGDGWTLMPRDRLDARGWITRLNAGETAPRPLMIPPDPFVETHVRCTWTGQGTLSPGGAARVDREAPGQLDLILSPVGGSENGAWVELTATDPLNPLKELDCRDPAIPVAERFQPEFRRYLRNFSILRFLDWQRTNDNAAVDWATRTLPQDSSQITTAGASIEDMVDLANRTGTDPWFLMPYRADDGYVRAFAQAVHDRLDPARTVYVELGNEVWNTMFDAAQQAEREGVAMGLDRDPRRAQAKRYAMRVRDVMRVWTPVFADRPGRLVRVAASQHADASLSDVILSYRDTAQWVDALATAPYIWLDLEDWGVGDIDRVFARLPQSVDATMEMAVAQRAVAAKFGKRYIAYEGGQHLVTRDLDLARAVQRDSRMGAIYRRYLDGWDKTARSELALYASTAPIGDYGAWGLREYAGQPASETPKLIAVRQALARFNR